MLKLYSKARISRLLAWPVGLERLSEIFGGVRQEEGMDVWYRGKPEMPRDALYWNASVAKIIDLGVSYPIFEVRFRGERWAQARGEAWSLFIYPVEATVKRRVRDMLEAEAFPRAYEWLAKERPESWGLRSWELSFRLVPGEDRLECQEKDGRASNG